tara:strand:- start:396 stop:632 length:237 start_codon:yes stop_codon:yes gene_type:complete
MKILYAGYGPMGILGCSSLAWALINREKKVGFPWHILEEEFDTGDIVLQNEIDVKNNENAFSLWNKVNLKGVNLLTKQ